MAKFTHYLVTRFNVPVESWHHDKSGTVTLDENWFQHRLDLFQKFCVPAVAQQSLKNFQWLIYCDRATHPDQLRNIEEAIVDVPKASIRLAENISHLLTDLKVLMSQCATFYVISSRLDNDDGISNDYVRTVQEHFEEQDKILINLDGGVLYDIDDKVLTQLNTESTNAFTSLIEKNTSPENLLTVLGFHHTDVPDGVKVVHVKKGLHWLKIIHLRNVRSSLRGRPVFNNHYKDLAGFNTNEFPVSFVKTLRYVLRRRWELWTSK